jgi:sugar lactone lactonase YvrE
MRAFGTASCIAAVTLVAILSIPASAHPGSGIVVDEKGQVFFADLSRGLLKIDRQGKVTSAHKEGGHWLALDPEGIFSRVDFERSGHWPRWFKRRTPAGAKPTLITDGGSPLVVGRDGNLYYACDDERLIPGGLQIARLSPDGKEALLNPELRRIGVQFGGIKGLTFGVDGSLYASYPKAVVRITTDGRSTILANPVLVNDCDKDVPTGEEEPFLRGLAVDARGTVYVAATGCRCVVKIAPDGKVSTVLKAEPPWSPSGVAVHGDDVYVLEHINPISNSHEDWPPRVRRLRREGKVSTLVTISAEGSKPAR